MKQEENEIGNLKATNKILGSTVANKDSHKQSITNLKAIFDHTTEGLILLDTNGVLKAFNSKALQNHRLTKNIDDLEVGRKLVDYIREDRKAFFEGLIAGVLQGETVEYDIDYDTKTGQKCWFNTVLSPVREEGTITGICLVRNEITERKKAEELIRHSEEKRRLIMNAALDAIVCIDTKGFITFWNPQAEKIFGWKEAEVMGRLLSEIIIPEPFRKMHDKGIANYLKTGHGPALNVLLELSAINRQQKEFPIELTVLPIKQDGEEFFCAFVRDITQRKLHEKAIVESEKKHRNLFQSSPMPMWVIDTDSFAFLDVNESAIKLLGYSKEELLSMSIDKVWYDDGNISQLSKKLGTYKETNSAFQGLIKYQTKSGQIITTEVHSHAIVFDQRHAMLTQATDITEKLEAERIIQLSEQRFRALVQEGADLIAIVNQETVFEYVSPNSIYIVGTPPEFYIGKRILDVVHDEDKERILSHFELFETKKQVAIHPFRLKGCDDKWHWIETIATNMMNDPSVAGIVTNSRNVTERIDYEIKLKESNERFEMASRAANDAIFEWDIVENTAYWGEGLETIFGHKRTAGKMDPAIWMNNLDPTEFEKLQANLKAAFEQQLPTHTREYKFRCGDGSYKTVFDKSIILYNDEGQAVKMIGAMQDITVQKHQEHEKELLIEELTQNNKNLKQFSFITSHNLRAPVSNLLGLMQLVDMSNIDDPLLLEVLDGIKTSTGLLNDTINDLSKVLVVKNNTAVPQENIVLHEMLEKVLGQIKNLIDEHQPELNVSFEKIPSIPFSNAYMESIFLNLLTNAIKYQSPLRRLKINIATYRSSDNKITMNFSDNGIGLDVERYKDRLFGLYQRFHNHPDSRGLGLYLVRSQLESLGGTIEIKSKIGEGTTFILTFKKTK